MLLTRPMLFAALRRYFYSGWAFLIPYLFFYLLYYVTKWPVHATSVPTVASGETVQSSPASGIPLLPCLLHVYWALHAIHVILAGVALWSWWKYFRPRDYPPTVGNKNSESSLPPLATERSASSIQRSPQGIPIDYPSSDFRPLTSDLWSPASGIWHLAIRLAPWLLLALLFYIPGVYLEWPSDPWEHLRRINEWHIHDTVGAHSSWHKSAYFIPYSLLSWCIGLRQLFWLDFYYTGICLLLCWQYYRLSRACGLGERSSMVFIILQALLFGNNIFSFYRYYGISSSIYAQLGAVALTRLVLEWVSWGRPHFRRGAGEFLGPTVRSSPASGSWLPTPRSLAASRPRFFLHPSSFAFQTRPSFWHLSPLFCLLTSASCLLVLTALNHIQGLAIAGLSIASIACWRLVAWRPIMFFFLAAAGIAVNVFCILWWPRHPIIQSEYLPGGWLDFKYGFNLFSLRSPAADRALQILGALGLLNIAVGALLSFRSHIVAWLTLGPVVGLSLPVVAIPFANSVASLGTAGIVTFHRMLFAVPSGLAIIVLSRSVSETWKKKRTVSHMRGSSARRLRGVYEATLLVPAFSLIALAGELNSSRVWHTMAVVPDDLELRLVWQHIDANTPLLRSTTESHVLSLGPVGFLSKVQNTNAYIGYRNYLLNACDPANDANAVTAILRREDLRPTTSVLLIEPTGLFSPYSLAGKLSSHWPAQESAFTGSGTAELTKVAEEEGFVGHPRPGVVVFTVPQAETNSI